MSKTYYLHTLDGQPAFFNGTQVVFAMYAGKAAPLAHDLRQIRREQQASKRWRRQQGYEDFYSSGYRRVSIPD